MPFKTCGIELRCSVGGMKGTFGDLGIHGVSTNVGIFVMLTIFKTLRSIGGESGGKGVINVSTEVSSSNEVKSIIGSPRSVTASR